MRVLSNMQFWQSPLWRNGTDSIYLVPERAEDEQEEFSVWRQAWVLYRQRKQYDRVVTMGIRESMAYAALCALTGQASRQVMTEVFVDQARPNSFLWKVKNRLYGWLARRAVGIITNSTDEIETTAQRFGVERDRLTFIPLCPTRPPEVTAEEKPPYVLSAGRTLRDYELMWQVAERLDVPVVIVCGQDDLPGRASTERITIHREIDRARYLDLLRGSAVVALPLLPTERSTGQVVFLEAMAMGKPVITTRSPGTIDYVAHERSGWLIETSDSEALYQACVMLLGDMDLRQRLGEAALAWVREHGAPDQYAQRFLDAVNSFPS